MSELPVQDGRVEDMHSSPPVRAPKSQLAVKQTLTGGCWNPSKKDTLLPKTRRNCNDMVGGVQSR